MADKTERQFLTYSKQVQVWQLAL